MLILEVVWGPRNLEVIPEKNRGHEPLAQENASPETARAFEVFYDEGPHQPSPVSTLAFLWRGNRASIKPEKAGILRPLSPCIPWKRRGKTHKKGKNMIELRWAKLPIASVQQTWSTLAAHTAIPRGTTVA